MNNVLIAISNYYDLIFLQNIKHIINNKIDCVFLLRNNFSTDELNDISKIQFEYKVSFISSLKDICDIKYAFISNDNLKFYNKIKRFLNSKFKLELHTINIKNLENNQKTFSKLVFKNYELIELIKSKPIIYVGGICHKNLQIDFELFLYNKLKNENVRFVSFFSQKINSVFYSSNDLLSEILCVNHNKDIVNEILHSDLIVIGLGYDLLDLNNINNYLYYQIVKAIKPDSFVIVTPTKYNKKYLLSFQICFKTEITHIVDSCYNFSNFGGDNDLLFPSYKTCLLSKKIKYFNDYYLKIIKNISLPDNIIKYNFM